MDAAQKRKDRLRALQQAAALSDKDKDEKGTEMPELKFRNYSLKDDSIEHTKVAPAKAQVFEEISQNTEGDSLDRTGEEVVIDVAPKKANWDLKRDVAQKLQKLERRTQRALLEIMQEMSREKFISEGGIADGDEQKEKISDGP